MKITFITVGKLKEKYLKDAVAEYAKRLSRYVSFSVVEVTDEKVPDNISSAEEDAVRRKEGERILKSIKTGSFVIATAIEGRQFSSEELAGKISELTLTGTSHICFIIGGSVGLSAEVIERADLLLSFSRFTFPHQLMRVILSEQVYRAFKIISNEPYHK